MTMRSPPPTNEVTSRVMRSNKGKDTRPELILRKSLRDAGYPGYRIHFKAPGRPDISYPGRRIAIFVHGCFWHRCPMCDLPLPKNNTDYWNQKFKRNIERDKENISALEDMGWSVRIVWECELLDDLKCTTASLISLIKSRDSPPK